MLTILARLFGVYDGPVPDDLKVGRLDRLDGVTTRRETPCST